MRACACVRACVHACVSVSLHACLKASCFTGERAKRAGCTASACISGGCLACGMPRVGQKPLYQLSINLVCIFYRKCGGLGLPRTDLANPRHAPMTRAGRQIRGPHFWAAAEQPEQQRHAGRGGGCGQVDGSEGAAVNVIGMSAGTWEAGRGEMKTGGSGVLIHSSTQRRCSWCWICWQAARSSLVLSPMRSSHTSSAAGAAIAGDAG